jgi:hypothetical protein
MAATTRRPIRLAVLTGSRTDAGVRLTRATFGLSGALAVVAAAAMAATIFVPGVLRGLPAMNGSARGTALVLLVVTIPTLVLAMLFAARGSLAAALIWIGALAHVLYNSVLFLFATPFNSLFPLYVAMFSLALFSVILIVRRVDAEDLRARFSARLPVRAIAAYVLLIVVLNAIAWLKGVVPGLLSSGTPSFLDGTGLTTSPTYIEDLAFWLPLMAVAAVWLWRRLAWGYLVVGSMLVTWTIESLTVATDQWMGHLADPASPAIAVFMAPVFLVLAIVGLVPLFVYYRDLVGRPARWGAER